jgi:hypothetical protein
MKINPLHTQSGPTPRRHWQTRTCFAMALMLMATSIAQAQLGSGWTRYTPTKKIHLDGASGDPTTFNWTTYQSNCSPTICADYRYDSGTDSETFRILDNRSNRSEIRLYNEYSTGSRQFEGYVTFYSPLNDESLMQIFGSTDGATQLMIRGYAADGGSIRAAGKTLATGVYGEEVRVNVIHLQENVGNKIIIYINGVKKAEIADNEAVTNYHKYGNYGTMRTGEAVVKWRRARFYRDGRAPASTAADEQSIAASTNIILESFPNPGTSNMTVKYTLREAGHANVYLYNTITHQITTLVNEHQPAGTYETTVDVGTLPAGIHFFKGTVNGQAVEYKFIKK